MGPSLIDAHPRPPHRLVRPVRALPRPLDVVANLCVTCNEYWACHRCHEGTRSHPFGRATDDLEAVACGVCGLLMRRVGYQSVQTCPGCGAGFNPGCRAHAGLYFEV